MATDEHLTQSGGSPPEPDPYKTVVANHQTDPNIGRTVSNCTIKAKIGEGGMAVVYKASHRSLGVDRVIKILRPGFYGFQNYKERFLREARLVARMDHRNIVRVYNADEENDTLFIEMEHLDGNTLRDRLKRDGKLSIEETKSIAGQICDALSYAQSRQIEVEGEKTSTGIIHRDIKPENIMVTPDGMAKLMDFGVAKPIEATSVTEPGAIVGTYAYMSPEQIEGGKVDHRSDIYSLGVVWYEMLAGKLPYEGNTITQLAMEISSGKSIPLRNHGISKAADAVILKAMSLKCEDRFSNAAEFKTALHAIKVEKVKRKRGGTGRLRLAIRALSIGIALLLGYGFLANKEDDLKDSPGDMAKETALAKKTLPMPPPGIEKLPSPKKLKAPLRPVKAKRKKPVKKNVPKNWLSIGMKHAAGRDWKKASNAFELVPPPAKGGNKKNYAKARMELARIQMNVYEDIDGAIKGLETITRHMPYKEVHVLLGACYIRKRMYRQACEVLRKAISKGGLIEEKQAAKAERELNHHLGIALEGRIYTQGEKGLVKDAMLAWQNVRKLSCADSKNKYCRQANSHIEKLNRW